MSQEAIDFEKFAREVLASQLRADGHAIAARVVREGEEIDVLTSAIRAIAKQAANAERYLYLRDEAVAGDWHKLSGPHSGMLMIGKDLDDAIDQLMAPKVEAA